MTLMHPARDPNPSLHLAGSCRLSVGFMQALIELLSKPKDVVLDWTVGEGSTFWAGDFSGRFVIGLEDRPKFSDAAYANFLKIHARKTPEVAKGKGHREVGKEKEVVDLDEEEDKFADLLNFVAEDPTPNLEGGSNSQETLE